MPLLKVSLHVTGTREFGDLSHRLKTAGPVLRRQLLKELADAVRPLPSAARERAIRTLPGSRRPSGLGSWLVARTQFDTKSRVAGDVVMVRVRASSSHDIARIDRGTVRHPLFGDRRYWYTNSVRPGWWTGPETEVAPRVTAAGGKALEAVAQGIDLK